jgi:ABC-type sugar transport system ATPase subunit
MKNLLEIQNLEKTFGATKALRDVCFTLHNGEIHSLVGENGAGKSTLIKILAGVHRRDHGKIFIEDAETDPLTPRDAQMLGISTVFQELSLCPNLTVAENIFVNREPDSFGIIKRKELMDMTREHLKSFNIHIEPDTPVKDLNLSQKQIIEIVKAFSIKAKILILDEPTSALEITEANILFDLLKKLKESGTGIIFVSHKLDEVFKISDRITVFRDGQYVGTKAPGETSQSEIISMMVGRNIDFSHRAESSVFNKEIFSVKEFTHASLFSDVSFNLLEGEILGFSGLTGSGRSELIQTIIGYLPKEKGEVYLNGKKLDLINPAAAIKNKIVYLPEDRKEQGLFLLQSIRTNVSASSLEECSDYLLIDREKEISLSSKYVADLSIKISNIEQEVESLSGGNQQKVLLAKCLATKPKILIVDEPTRGIDIGSKMEIHQILKEFVKNGGSVILISSDLPEVISLSDRVLIFKDGKIKGEVKEDISENSIMNIIFNN